MYETGMLVAKKPSGRTGEIILNKLMVSFGLLTQLIDGDLKSAKIN